MAASVPELVRLSIRVAADGEVFVPPEPRLWIAAAGCKLKSLIAETKD